MGQAPCRLRYSFAADQETEGDTCGTGDVRTNESGPSKENQSKTRVSQRIRSVFHLFLSAMSTQAIVSLLISSSSYISEDVQSFAKATVGCSSRTSKPEEESESDEESGEEMIPTKRNRVRFLGFVAKRCS